MSAPYEIELDRAAADHPELRENCEYAMNYLYALKKWLPPRCFKVDVRSNLAANEWTLTITRPDGVLEQFQVPFGNNTAHFFEQLFEGAYVRHICWQR